MLTEKPTGEIRTAYDLDNEPYLFEATGTEAKHFCDILRAEDDGRLVILPCKVGSHVWRVWITDGRKPEITEHYMSDLLHIIQWIGKFGKTVFLSREEAEAALKGEQDDV